MAERKKAGSTKAGVTKKKAASSTNKKATAKKAAPQKAASTASTASTKKPAATSQSLKVITAEERWHMVSEAAYYQAEKRGFVGGHPADDWAAAEKEIDAMLEESNTVVKS